MNKLFTYASIALVFVSLMCSSCNHHSNEDAPDVSKINLSYASYPFYKDFAAIDTTHIAAGLMQLRSKYPEFTDFYLDTMFNFGYHHQYNDTNSMMHDYLTNKDFRRHLDTLVAAFPDTKKYDEYLRQSFKYLRYYDSTFDIPEHVYYFPSFLAGGANGSPTALITAKEIGIALDRFLGRDYKPYQQVAIPDFVTIRMTADNIPVWVSMAIFEDKYRFNPDDKDLLNLIIQKGKEMYFVEKLTPYLNDEVRLGFTKAQLEWCKKNEALIYNFLVQNQLLFDKNLQKTLRYVNDGPSAAGMPVESPGNVGSYLGLVIVKKYLERHPMSMHQLFEIKNAQEILEGANYKP